MALKKAVVLCLLFLALLGGSAPAGEKDGKPDKKLAAKLRKLLPAAAAVDTKTVAAIGAGRITEPMKMKSQTLTVVIALWRYHPAFKTDLNISAAATAKQVTEATMTWDGTMTVLRADHITKVTCRRLKGGKRARGTVSVKSKICSGTLPFEAELVGGKWRISAFNLPVTARRVALGKDGKWKLTKLPTKDPMILLLRGMRYDLKKAVPLPAAFKSQRVTSKALAPYGELHFHGVKPLKFADKGKGVFVFYAADAKFSEVTAAAKDPKSGKYRPLAVATADHRFPLGFLPLPEITAKPKKSKLDTITIKIGVGTKKTFRFSIREYTTGDPNELASRLKQLRFLAEMPLRLAPDKDAPLRALVAAVDCCLRAKFDLKGITIDPGKPPAKKK